MILTPNLRTLEVWFEAFLRAHVACFCSHGRTFLWWMAASLSNAGGLLPITELTDEEASGSEKDELKLVGGLARKRKRREGPTLKDRLRSREWCKQFVLKRCGGKCRKPCLKQFSGKQLFEELLQFRQHWSELHKLDADRLVARQITHVYFVFGGRTRIGSASQMVGSGDLLSKGWFGRIGLWVVPAPLLQWVLAAFQCRIWGQAWIWNLEIF